MLHIALIAAEAGAALVALAITILAIVCTIEILARSARQFARDAGRSVRASRSRRAHG
jgi:hypothetical protein